jgi:hypothetical protein
VAANYVGTFEIGINRNGGAPVSNAYFDGALDSFRIQKSDVFSANPVVGLSDTITVPTSEPVADDDTRALLNFNESPIVDESNIGHSVTVVNTSSISSPKFGTGSLKLNGSSQYLTVPDSDSRNFYENSVDDWTVDCWIKLDSLSGNNNMVVHRTNDSNYWAFSVDNTTGTLSLFNRVSGTFSFTQGGTVTTGVWHHVAAIKVGNVLSIYLDGQQVAYNTNTQPSTYNGELWIGSFAGVANFFAGSMDELRIQKSNYFSANPVVGLTDTITVPTGPYTADLNTKLLLSFDSDPIVDESGAGNTVTPVNNPEFEYSYFGEGAAYFDGTGDYLTVSDSGSFNVVGSNIDNWTIDCWIRTDSPGTEQYIVSQREDNGNRWALINNTIGLTFLVTTAGVNETLLFSGSPEITDTDWHHVAMCKVGSNYGLYVDGVQVAYQNSSHTDTFSADLVVGQRGDNSDYFHGNIDELRIQCENSLSANPNAGLTDTITVPVEQYTQEGRPPTAQGIIIT